MQDYSTAAFVSMMKSVGAFNSKQEENHRTTEGIRNGELSLQAGKIIQKEQRGFPGSKCGEG